MIIVDDTYIWNENDLNTAIRALREEAYNKITKEVYEMFGNYIKECYIRDEKLNIQVKETLGQNYYIETHIVPPKTGETFDSCMNFSFKKSDESKITKKEEVILKGYCDLHFKKLFPLSHRAVKIVQEQMT